MFQNAVPARVLLRRNFRNDVPARSVTKIPVVMTTELGIIGLTANNMSSAFLERTAL
jgi:hypothetical protein